MFFDWKKKRWKQLIFGPGVQKNHLVIKLYSVCIPLRYSFKLCPEPELISTTSKSKMR